MRGRQGGETLRSEQRKQPRKARVAIRNRERGDRMKRVIVDHYGGPEVLRIVEEEVPRPGPGEVRVRVLAAGVSYTDAMLRVGSYLGMPKPVAGYELVGVVRSSVPDAHAFAWETVSAR